MVVAVALPETAVLLANASKTTSLTALVNGLRNPVDARVAANRLVVRINKDNLVVFVNTVLVYPVRVEHTQVPTPTADALLRDAAETPLELEVVHTLAYRFAVSRTLRDGLLPVTSSHSDAVDHKALLGLVSESAGLVRARRARCTVDDVQLTVLPASDTEKKAKHIRLLFLVQLTDVLVGAHVAG